MCATDYYSTASVNRWTSMRSIGMSDNEIRAREQPLDHSMHKISHAYVKHYDDPEEWMYSAWMALTDQGEHLARSLEQKDIASYRL